tara:strand:- start:2452 stop:2658 length:207 start_codon:yes stop_codon:yes gene_type:complete
MMHLLNSETIGLEICINETEKKETEFFFTDSEKNEQLTAVLSPKELNDFIGILLHVQAKKRKQFKTKF